MTKKLEWCRGKVRVKQPRLLGKDEKVTPIPPSSEESAPQKDPNTGRMLPGNQLWKRRQLRKVQRGISTLDPRRCQTWMIPAVRDAGAYAMDLLKRFPDPALARLVGDTVDSHTMYIALLGLAAAGDVEARKEARAWLREHRAALATLAGLAGDGTTPTTNGSKFFVDVAVDETEEKDEGKNA